MRDRKVPLLALARLPQVPRLAPAGLRHQVANPVDLILQPVQVVRRDLEDVSLRLRPPKAVVRAQAACSKPRPRSAATRARNRSPASQTGPYAAPTTAHSPC